MCRIYRNVHIVLIATLVLLAVAVQASAGDPAELRQPVADDSHRVWQPR